MKEGKASVRRNSQLVAPMARNASAGRGGSADDAVAPRKYGRGKKELRSDGATELRNDRPRSAYDGHYG